MEREQIIKALECCSDCDCYNAKMQEDCPFINVPFCKNYLRKQSLSLIKELTEENEKWKSRIPIECEYTKADTVKKMRERLKAKAYVPKPYGVSKVVDEYDIDQIAKEMLEGNDE